MLTTVNVSEALLLREKQEEIDSEKSRFARNPYNLEDGEDEPPWDEEEGNCAPTSAPMGPKAARAILPISSARSSLVHMMYLRKSNASFIKKPMPVWMRRRSCV